MSKLTHLPYPNHAVAQLVEAGRGRSRVRFPMLSLDFFHLHNPSGRSMALGSPQPLTEMSTKNNSWG